MKSKKIFCFDIDNTLCKTINSNYSKSKPYKKKINFINQLYDNGHKIIILTARYMGRNGNSIYKAKKQGYLSTFRQLKLWGLKFHELHISKPASDFYIDDKSLYFKKNWIIDLIKYTRK